ncbi:hypothetical protein L1787_13745 [Acuticoccus sp. M5D2P5]|uniref:hypothetical protein n=1 Tax=Acuticoccus kalidii TaxID=2910977 RepID=UPI001F22239F|nr:hypothetical protein [Acuticoccus kalidii]MCF3934467.1 hypothetical protein [Acuticoccus kalidii]
MVEIALNGLESREGLVQRLFAAFAVQVRDVETRIARQGAEIVEDTKLLSGLAKTLETLISLDRKLTGEAAGETLDPGHVRAVLAERLARMNPANKAGAAKRGRTANKGTKGAKAEA